MDETIRKVTAKLSIEAEVNVIRQMGKKMTGSPYSPYAGQVFIGVPVKKPEGDLPLIMTTREPFKMMYFQSGDQWYRGFIDEEE